MSKAAPASVTKKLTVILDDELLARIWAEQRRVKEETGFQVSQSQIAARLLERHLPKPSAGVAA